MKVLLYGRLADAIDRQVDVQAADGCTVAEIRERLATGHPNAADALRRSRVCLAGTIVGDDRRVGADDEIEFLPPVSGG